MRSGMRSWSKWVIFSRRMKSSSSAGPRSPALSEFWLSAMATPWLVVSIWPAASTRTLSSEPGRRFSPDGGMSPVLADALVSLSVLATALADDGSAVWPAGGETALSWPKSSGLPALCGNAPASASTAAAFCVAASIAATAAGCDGPLDVVFGAADLPAALALLTADFFMVL